MKHEEVTLWTTLKGIACSFEEGPISTSEEAMKRFIDEEKLARSLKLERSFGRRKAEEDGRREAEEAENDKEA